MKTSDAYATSGTIWLGCRLSTKGVRAERFSGAMDELFIADRALRPREILPIDERERAVSTPLICNPAATSSSFHSTSHQGSPGEQLWSAVAAAIARHQGGGGKRKDRERRRLRHCRESR
jgi:hypothetical protein